MASEQNRGDADRKADRNADRASDRDSERTVPNPVQVQKFLGGLDYPVGKKEIVDKARGEGADEIVIGALERIPDREYDSPTAVSREVGKLD